MAKHARLSPSSAERWMTCPGSVVLSDGLVDKSSAFADEGTAAHFLGAHCLEHNQDAGLHKGRTILLLLNTLTGAHTEAFEDSAQIPANEHVLNSFVVDTDMVDYVRVYLNYVRDVVKSTNGALFVEVSVPISHLTGEAEAYGTADAVVLAGDEIIVIDLKYGRGVEVSAIENKQLLMYASGAMNHFSLSGDFTNVRTAIVQPRVSTQPSEWSCLASTLREFESEAKEAASTIWRMVENEVPLVCVPAADACKWCKAKAKCEALEKEVQAEVGNDFDNLLLNKAPDVSQFDTATLGKKMACLDMIEDWCKAIRAQVEHELFSGHAVPGYKLVQGRKGARSWSNPVEAEALLKSMRLKVDQMYDLKLISPTTAEKVLADTPKRWVKVQQCITQSEGKPSVAPLTDKRPAITVTPVADDFEVV